MDFARSPHLQFRLYKSKSWACLHYRFIPRDNNCGSHHLNDLQVMTFMYRIDVKTLKVCVTIFFLILKI